MTNTAEDLSNNENNVVSIGDYSNLEKTIMAEGILNLSDEHGSMTFAEGVRYAAANDLLYVSAGDGINDYNLPNVLQEATKRGYKFRSQLEMEHFNKSYQDGKISEKEYMLYNAVKIAEYNDVTLDQVLDHFVNEGKFGENTNFSRDDKTFLINLLDSDLTQKRFEQGFTEMRNSSEYQENMFRNLNLVLTFMKEEVKQYQVALNENPNAKMAIVRGNHDPVFYGELIKEGLDNPDQVTIINEDAYVVNVKNKNGGELAIIGDTNCLQPMGFYQELLDPEVMQIFYKHQFEGTNQENLFTGNFSKDTIESFNPKTQWYNTVNQVLDGRDYMLVTHGPIGSLGSMVDVPQKKDVHKMSLESIINVHGHIHKITDDEKNQAGVGQYGVAGDKALIIDINDYSTSRVQLDATYGNGMENPLQYDPKHYLDLAEQNLQNGINPYSYLAKYIPSNMLNNETEEDQKAA
jgi:hypothetical protein